MNTSCSAVKSCIWACQATRNGWLWVCPTRCPLLFPILALFNSWTTALWLAWIPHSSARNKTISSWYIQGHRAMYSSKERSAAAWMGDGRPVFYRKLVNDYKEGKTYHSQMLWTGKLSIIQLQSLFPAICSSPANGELPGNLLWAPVALQKAFCLVAGDGVLGDGHHITQRSHWHTGNNFTIAQKGT